MTKNLPTALTRQHINLPFRGERNYFQGPDICHEMLKFAGPVRRISIQLHQLTGNALSIQVVNSNEVAALRDRGELQSLLSAVDHSGKPLMLAVVVEADAVSNAVRLPLDENLIVKDAIVTEKYLFDRSTDGVPFIQRIVALNKFLLQKLTGHLSWVFFRLDLNEFPITVTDIELTVDRELGDGNFITSIVGDGVKIGRIFFTRRTA